MQNWLRSSRANLPSPFCRSRIVADETRDGIVIAGGHENKIAFIKNKQHAQIASDAAFVKSAKRPDANAGVQMWPTENVRQPSNHGINSRLLRRRQPLEGALIRRPGENHGRQGLSFPSRRSRLIPARTFAWAHSTSFGVTPYSSYGESGPI